MTPEQQVVAGLAAGATISVASTAAGLDASAPLVIGVGAGAVLALTERSRPAGVALIAASLLAVALRSQSRRLRSLAK